MARTTNTTRRQRTARTSDRSSGTRSRRPSTGRRRTPTRTPRQARRTDPGIQAFLERLASALTSGDAETAAACFEYPSVMVMSDVRKYGPNQVLHDRETAARVFARAPEMYHERGIHDTFPDVEDAREIADGLVLVRTRFPYIDADGNDTGDGETSLYVVRKEAREGMDGYAICAAITLGADSERAA
jgi:hypothetical protein